MSRLFISHSSGNDDWALALQAWLIREGWSGEEDIFLDLDPERGIVAGQRWARALEDAASRCEAVLFLVSEVSSRNGAATNTNSPTDSIRSCLHC